jgi:hypothetical protein
MAKMGDDTLFGMLTNGAGVYQNDVRFLDTVAKYKSRIFKRRVYQGRIQLIHLAPEAFNMYCFAAHIGSSVYQLERVKSNAGKCCI